MSSSRRMQSLVVACMAAVSLLVVGLAAQNAPSSPDPALKSFSADRVLAHIKKLASDEFEGRAPGSKGEELTVNYLTGQFKAAGLAAGNPDGTYIQKVPMVGITGDPSMTLTFRRGQQEDRLGYLEDFVAWTRHVAPSASIEDSELVFVGYGVVAPEFKWDDYKGVDLHGKTMVVLVNGGSASGISAASGNASAPRPPMKSYAGRPVTRPIRS